MNKSKNKLGLFVLLLFLAALAIWYYYSYLKPEHGGINGTLVSLCRKLGGML